MAHIKATCVLIGLLDLCKACSVVAKEVKTDDTSSPPWKIRSQNVLLGWPYPSAPPSGKSHPQRVYEYI